MRNQLIKNSTRLVVCSFLLLVSFYSFSQDSTQKETAAVNSNGTVTVVANPTFRETWIKKIFIGKNYRKEWTQPITVPVLNMQKLGLIPEKEGGGKQTRSLHVKDSSSKKWALRSIKKYPGKVIPDFLKKTIGEKIVEDDISASYPYAALSMRTFSRAAGVPYLKNSLTYLPDDTALGKFRDKYKETLTLMEEREPYELFGNPDKKLEGLSTLEVNYKLQEKNKNRVDQLSVLRLRLLDNFVMDFDRHEGQWNWYKKDSAGANYYFPVPKDRDQVFYINEGVLPKLISSKSLFPELQGFHARVRDIPTFNRAAQNFDRNYLNEPNEEDWSRAIDYFLSTMTDAVIDSALAQQPKEIQPYAAPEIAATLKKKKQYFKSQMMYYYRTLAGTVSIPGSNQDENFLVKAIDDTTLQVTVIDADSSLASTPIYNRIFNSYDTKEIRLYGLDGNDHFILQGNNTPIKIRMIGGPGEDQFINESQSRKVYAYDVTFEKNLIKGTVHNKMNNDPENNVYNHLNFKYNVGGISPAVEISARQGFFLGFNYQNIRQGFHKQPYASRQFFSATHSLNSSSMHFRYDADYTNILPHTDLLVRSDLMTPTNKTSFFGLGNNTRYDKTQYQQSFYRMRYDIGDLAILGRSKLGRWVSLEYGPAVEYLKLREKENDNRFISVLYPKNSNPGLYQKKWYAGGEARLIVDTRNNQTIATEGIYFNGYVRTLAGLNQYSYNYTQVGGQLALYTDFATKGYFVFATNIGGDRNIGNFEPEQAQYLGFKDHLRGYVLQRFAGRSKAYNQTELRIKFGEINTLLIRADLGVFGFNDVGRVWTDGETSTKWQDGYGGGIWLSVMKRFVMTGYLSFSKEVKALPRATLGFMF